MDVEPHPIHQPGGRERRAQLAPAHHADAASGASLESIDEVDGLFAHDHDRRSGAGASVREQT